MILQCFLSNSYKKKDDTMKKSVLISALLATTLAMAGDYKYELSPMIGLNLAEGNLGIKNDINNGGYPVFGLELQVNTPDSKLSPEFSVFYSNDVDYLSGRDTSIIRGAFNGVYAFDKQGSITPFLKAGAGYEQVGEENTAISTNPSGFFLDAGAGLKVALLDKLALKLEAVYMAKPGTDNSGFADSNLMTMVGFSYSFGQRELKPAPVAVKKVEPVVAVVVLDGDDDNDGVLNSKDKCPKTLQGAKVNASGCELDDDNDGVANSKDRCQNTPTGVKVDTNGCALDSDKDGVADANDKCPNTPIGGKVNEDGCPETVPLKIHFDNDSANVTDDSAAELNRFADFLTTYTNYHAKIVGHTDSKGSADYNQKLSQKRADAVVSELVKRGVNPEKLTSLGKGESEPIASNTTKEDRAKNRRTEAELTRK